MIARRLHIRSVSLNRRGSKMAQFRQWLDAWRGRPEHRQRVRAPNRQGRPHPVDDEVRQRVDLEGPSEQFRRKRVEALVNHLSEASLDA
jgi:hypothetical protein